MLFDLLLVYVSAIIKRVSPNPSKAFFFSGRTWPRPLHVLAVPLFSAGWGIGNCGADLLECLVLAVSSRKNDGY